MTKYILAGGNIHKDSDGGQAFFEELVRGFGDKRPIKILNCLFALDEALEKEVGRE
jgi:hypothetical protein